RASSCAAAIASWLLIVSLLKSIYLSVLYGHVWGLSPAMAEFVTRSSGSAAAPGGRGRGRAGTAGAPPATRHASPLPCARVVASSAAARPRGTARARRRPG